MGEVELIQWIEIEYNLSLTSLLLNLCRYCLEILHIVKLVNRMNKYYDGKVTFK